jgi:hypothetical protein
MRRGGSSERASELARACKPLIDPIESFLITEIRRGCRMKILPDNPRAFCAFNERKNRATRYYLYPLDEARNKYKFPERYKASSSV